MKHVRFTRETDAHFRDIIKNLITVLISIFLIVGCAGNPGNTLQQGSFVDNKDYGEAKIVCAAYIALWGVYDPVTKKNREWTVDDIGGNLLTDLILSFATLSNKDHVSLELDEYNDYKATVDKVHAKYKDLRISLAIGGASEGIDDFSAMAASSTLRGKFVANVKDFLKKNTSVCGIDIDWEYPGKSGSSSQKQKDIDNYILLLKELKEMMNTLGAENGINYRLTTALPADRRNLIENISEIQKYLDGINLMMYDYHGSWSKETGHNAPLDETEVALQKYLAAGASPEKIVFGVPFYGQRWKNVKADSDHPDGLGISVEPNDRGDYGIAYPEVLELLENKNYTKYWDDYAKAPYLYSSRDKVFVSYNDEKSIEHIIKVVQDNNLGGMMTWEYGQDMTLSLLKVMYKGCTE